MKSKIYILILTLVCILTLTSCQTTIGVDYVETESTTYTKIENDITTVYNTVNTGCVGIYAADSTSSATGSGVVYKVVEGVYYVITNAHVVEDMTTYRVFLGGVKYYDANLIGLDSTNDIAVLTFSLDILDTDIEIYINDIYTTTDLVSKGQTVIAIGCPLGLENFNTVSTGVVSLTNAEQIQHDASINPGNSGGGLFNLAGRLIGINSEKEVFTTGTIGGTTTQIPVEGMGYAINMSVVKNCVEKIEENNGSVTRPLLGVTVTAINRYLVAEDNIYLPCLPSGVDFACVVTTMTADSNATRGGIMLNDCILKADDVDVTSLTTISSLLHQKVNGDTIELYIYRSLTSTYVTLTINLTA